MKTVKSLPKGVEFNSGNGIQSKYDWDKILSGEIVMLVPGDDFAGKQYVFQTMCRNQAKKRGKGVNFKMHEDNLYVQAFDATPEQIAHWDDLNEGRKARKAEKKAAAKAAV